METRAILPAVVVVLRGPWTEERYSDGETRAMQQMRRRDAEASRALIVDAAPARSRNALIADASLLRFKAESVYAYEC